MDQIIHIKNPIPPSRRPLEMLSVWMLGVTIFLSVFFFIPNSVTPLLTTKSFLVAGCALLALVSYLIARLGRGNFVVPPLLLVGAFWLPLLAYAVSSLLGTTSLQSAFWGTALENDSLGFMLAVTVLATVTALALRNAEHYRALLRTFCITAGLLILVELFVLFVGQFSPNNLPSTFSITGSFEDLGILFALIVGVALLALRSLELPKQTIRALYVCIVVSLILLAVLASMFVWILLGLIAFGFFIEANVAQRAAIDKNKETDFEEINFANEPVSVSEASQHFLLAPFCIFVVSCVFLFSGSFNSYFARMLHVNVLSVRPSWQATLTVLSKTYEESPLVGHGPGSFSVQWNKYRSPLLNATPFWDTDFSSGVGFIPTSFVTVGLVGAVAWIVFFGLFMFVGLRTLILRAPKDPFVRFVSGASFFAATYLFVTMIFDVPGPIILALAFICSGLFVSTLRFADGEGQWGIVFAKAPRLSLGIVIILTFALLGSIAVFYPLSQDYLVQMDLSQANADSAANKYNGAFQAVQYALATMPTPEAEFIGASIKSSHLINLIQGTATDQSVQEDFQNSLSQGVQLALMATSAAPDRYQYWVVLGSIYATAVPFKVAGAYDKAKQAYQTAEALSPTNAQIPFFMAQLDLENGNTNAAEQDLKAAISLKQDYTAAIVLLSRLQVSDGDLQDALSSANAALYFSPNDPNILFQIGILKAASGDLQGAADSLNASITASPQFANGHYFLAVVYAQLKEYPQALAQIKIVESLSPNNASLVKSAETALAAGKNPFPSDILAASSAPGP